VYNRYIRNDQGTYTRVTEEEPHQGSAQSARNAGTQSTWNAGTQSAGSSEREKEPRSASPFSATADGIAQTLRRLLDRLHLDSVDTGDLLLLLLLLFLFQEDADEELLIALGLLLIL
jgi:hypothetical protein